MQLKEVIARNICRPFIGRTLSVIFHDQIPSNGMRIITNSKSISAETKAQIFWGIYESAEARFIRKYLPDDSDVIELGSSLGLTTCLIRRQIASSNRLISIEANQKLIDTIKSNLAINVLDREVIILNKAIDYSGNKLVWLNFGNDNTGSYVTDGHFEHRGENGAYVSTNTLLDIVREYQLLDYVLVSDIEGAEAGIFLNDYEALKKCRQIIIELHTTTYGIKKIDPALICDIIINQHGFAMRDQYGVVFVFEK